jgi:hypothetical protein
MEIINSNNIYINIGDNQFRLIQNEYIYDFKKYYFKNDIIIKYSKYNFKINLKNEKYFQVKFYNLGNFILLYVLNKNNLFFKTIIKIEIDISNYIYSNNLFLKYKLTRLIFILKNKLGKDIKLSDSIIFNINSKLNIIENSLEDLNPQKILYYIEYIKNTFLI